MSWIWGGRSNQQPQSFSDFIPRDVAGSGGAGDSGNNNNNKPSQNEAYRFDSSALERAAKAAKELEKSRYAKESLELLNLQEETRNLQIANVQKQYELQFEMSKLEQMRVNGERERKKIGEESHQRKMEANYQDQLARKRYDDQLMQQQKMNDENLRRQEESILREEATRRKTIRRELELRHELDMKKVSAEARKQGEIDRENHDLILEQIRLKAAEQRKSLLESINTVSSVIGAGLTSFLQDPDKILAAAGGLSLVALGVYAAKSTTGVTARYIEAHLGKPSLVRETSRFSALDIVRHPIKAIKKTARKAS